MADLKPTPPHSEQASFISPFDDRSVHAIHMPADELPAAPYGNPDLLDHAAGRQTGEFLEVLGVEESVRVVLRDEQS